MNEFYLQLGHPKINQPEPRTVERLKDVFLHLFYKDEESIFLFWHQIPIQFQYKQDLYNNFDFILAMVWYLEREEQGKTKVDMMNQLLFIHWELSWNGDDLSITANYRDTEDLFEPYAKALNNLPEISMSREQFLKEWKALLKQIITSIQLVDFKINDGKERRRWELLQKIEQSINGFGILYQKDSL